jgi:hypothetical protein
VMVGGVAGLTKQRRVKYACENGNNGMRFNVVLCCHA